MAETEPREARKGGGGKSVAVDTLDPKTGEHHIIPVWFFIGILLFVYGILILVSGIREWNHLPDTVLAQLHAPVWWGLLLIVIGGTFVVVHKPKSS